jgi:hypothetical protein
MKYTYLMVDRYEGITTRCEQFDFDDVLAHIDETGEEFILVRLGETE